MFARLWDGDLTFHQGDHSRADAALVAHLGWWTGGDPVRTDRLFRQSGLMRGKWDDRRGARTYGERTIAFSTQSVGHCPPARGRPEGRGELARPPPSPPNQRPRTYYYKFSK